MASIAPNQTTFVPATILPVTVQVPATLPVPTPIALGQDTYVPSVVRPPVAAPAAVANAPAPGLLDQLHALMQQLSTRTAPRPAQQAPAQTPAPTPPPKATPKPDAPHAPAPTYTVQSGDSLSAIAQKTLGNANRWHEIYDLNRDKISNPDLIQPGWVLALPGGASKPAPSPAPAPAGSGRPITDRNRIYLHQPNGWTCGPTSLTMAAAAFGLRPSSTATVDELVRRTRCNPNDGIPDSNAIPDAARQIGLNATHLSSSSPSDVRAALERGHGVVYNGSLGTGGHFIYVAGLNPDGSFIICDPWRPEITRMTDQQLNAFGHTNGHTGSMVEVWK